MEKKTRARTNGRRLRNTIEQTKNCGWIRAVHTSQTAHCCAANKPNVRHLAEHRVFSQTFGNAILLSGVDIGTFARACNRIGARAAFATKLKTSNRRFSIDSIRASARFNYTRPSAGKGKKRNTRTTMRIKMNKFFFFYYYSMTDGLNGNPIKADRFCPFDLFASVVRFASKSSFAPGGQGRNSVKSTTRIFNVIANVNANKKKKVVINSQTWLYTVTRNTEVFLSTGGSWRNAVRTGSHWRRKGKRYEWRLKCTVIK